MWITPTVSALANWKKFLNFSVLHNVSKEIAGQLELELIFNEAEALTETLYVVEPAEEDVIQVTRRKKKGKREEDLKDLPVEVIPHTLPEEKLQEIFGAAGWKQLPDEVYKRVRVQPAVYTVEEHHVAVYASEGTAPKQHPDSLPGGKHPECQVCQRTSLISDQPEIPAQ